MDRISRTTLERISDLKKQLAALADHADRVREAQRERTRKLEEAVHAKDHSGLIALSAFMCAAVAWTSLLGLGVMAKNDSVQDAARLVERSAPVDAPLASDEHAYRLRQWAPVIEMPTPVLQAPAADVMEPPPAPVATEPVNVARRVVKKRKRVVIVAKPADPQSGDRAHLASPISAPRLASAEDPLAFLSDCGDDPICGL